MGTLTCVRASRLFSLWRELFRDGRCAVLDDERASHLKRWLKVFSEEDLCDCLRGAARDPWTRGTDRNSPRAFDDVKEILKDAGKIERLRDMYRRQGGQVGEKQPSRPPEKFWDLYRAARAEWESFSAEEQAARLDLELEEVRHLGPYAERMAEVNAIERIRKRHEEQGVAPRGVGRTD